MATLAYSDSVYYYGQYTEAGSGSFLGATHRLSKVEIEVADSGMRAAYGLRVRHPCPFLATCDFTVYVSKAPVYHSVVFFIPLFF